MVAQSYNQINAVNSQATSVTTFLHRALNITLAVMLLPVFLCSALPFLPMSGKTVIR